MVVGLVCMGPTESPLILIQIYSKMAEILKQLKIKTSMLKRLRKEYESYDKETKGIQEKLNKLEQESTIIEKNEDIDIDIKKHVHQP